MYTKVFGVTNYIQVAMEILVTLISEVINVGLVVDGRYVK